MLRKILLSIFSILLVCGSFFIDYKLERADAQNAVPDVEVAEGAEAGNIQKNGDTYTVESDKNSRMVLVLQGNAVLRLAPESSADFTLSETADYGKKLLIQPKTGRFWINSKNSLLFAEIVTPGVRITAEPGIFDIQYGTGALSLTAHRRSMQVEFLDNKLILPEGRAMTLQESRIAKDSGIISRLRYSKLSKEFPYFEKESPDAWTKANQDDDKIFNEEVREKFIQKTKKRGPKTGGELKNSLHKAGLLFTFDSNRRSEKEAEFALDFFDSAVYAMVVGNRQLAEEMLSQFNFMATQLGSANSFLHKEAARRLSLLAFVNPYEPLFDAAANLRKISGADVLSALHVVFNDVLDTSAVGTDAETQTRTLTMLRRFGSLAAEQLGGIRNQNSADDVFYEYVVLNDFLARNPLLLREEFLKILEKFERSNLKLIASREEADDQRQFFISEKLKKIRVIEHLMSNTDMPFQDARKAILLIASHIDALQPAVSDSAVLAYFEDQMSSFAPLIAFLRSSDAERLHGSYKESFSDFKVIQDELKKVTELLSSAVGGEQISAFRREELASIVAADFGPAGIKDVKILLPEIEADPRVRVTNAVLEAESFTAVYDTMQKVFSEIVIEDADGKKEEIPNAVRLENLRKFFLVRSGKMTLPSGSTLESLAVAPEAKSIVERVAQQALLGELTGMNIKAGEENLDFKDFEEKEIIHINSAELALESSGDFPEAAADSGATAADAATIIFSCDVTQNASLIENLKVQTVSGEIPVNGTFALRDLATKVEQIYQQAAFEKKRAFELKKLLEEQADVSLE